jgi:hypothetical protein
VPGLLPSERRTTSDTMGDWKRLQAMADDPKPRLVRPPDGPYADLIRRVRLYAKDGAKALAPLLDGDGVLFEGAADFFPTLEHLPDEVYVQRHRFHENRAAARALAHRCEANCRDSEALSITEGIVLDPDPHLALAAIHAAYNSPWTVVDGEVFEVVTEKAKPEEVV